MTVIAFDAPQSIVDNISSGLVDVAIAQHPAEIGCFGVMALVIRAMGPDTGWGVVLLAMLVGIFAAVMGAFIIAVIQFGLVFSGLPPYWQFVAVGLGIVIPDPSSVVRELSGGQRQAIAVARGIHLKA